MPISIFQQKVIDLLKELFGSSGVSVEVNVKKLFPKYRFNDHHYDIVIKPYRLIVECHGEQHRTLAVFGGSKENAMETFHNQKIRDRNKEEIAYKNEWDYLIIWYKDFPTDPIKAKEFLKEKVFEAINN